MRVAYVEMIGGAAGDMLLAAFLDAGADRAALEAALRTVVPDGWTFAPRRVVRGGIAAILAGLTVPGEDGDAGHRHGPHEHGNSHAHRTLADVLEIVERSGLTPRQRERTAAVYVALAQAEARVHGTDVTHARFHEVGQIDAILDVAASCVALDLLAIDELRCSPFPIGHGTIGMAHGAYPNPPPATAELLRGWPTRSVDIAAELVTTTAAAIGYGAGSSDFTIPNVTRISIGTAAPGDGSAAGSGDRVVVLEANIDDMSPQHYELALERLFAAGARDVWLTPIVMKKGRPAITLSALALPADERAVAEAMLAQTTTLGVRVRSERRHLLERTETTIDTPYGPVRAKRAGPNGSARVRPEYDDLVRIARERGLALAEVARIVEAAAEKSLT